MTQGFAKTRWVNLKIIWGIFATINKNVHLLNEKGILLIKIKQWRVCIQRLPLVPPTPFRGFMVALVQRRFCLLLGGWSNFKQSSEINWPSAIVVALTGVPWRKNLFPSCRGSISTRDAWQWKHTVSRWSRAPGCKNFILNWIWVTLNGETFFLPTLHPLDCMTLRGRALF